MYSPPGQELLGVVTSHGPSRESYTPLRKSSDWQTKTPGPPAAAAAVSVERLRAAFSSAAGKPAVLQRALPPGGAEMVAVEGPAEVPHNGRGQGETQRPKPALPATGQEPETSRARGS